MKPERKITASAPGRINILGNPTDALEGAYAVISAAVELRARIKLKKNGKMTAAPADNPLSAASLSLELKKLNGAGGGGGVLVLVEPARRKQRRAN